MRRRQFIALLASAVLAWPPTAREQQPAVARRIAILSDFSELEMQPLIATFREQLQQLGWGDDSGLTLGSQSPAPLNSRVPRRRLSAWPRMSS